MAEMVADGQENRHRGWARLPKCSKLCLTLFIAIGFEEKKSATFTYERVPSIVIKINQLLLLQSLSTFLLLIKYFQFQHLGSVQCDGHHCNQHLDIRKLFTFL